MPPEDDPRTWIAYAWSWLALARSGDEHVLPVHGCFPAQQAAEVAIKAVIIAHGATPPFVHDLQHLLFLAEEYVAVPGDVWTAPVLTPFAVATRYPGRGPVVSRTDKERYIALAGVVVSWAEAVVITVAGDVPRGQSAGEGRSE